MIMTDADYDYILDKIVRSEHFRLNGILLLIVMMNRIDDNNNNAMFNAVLHYIMIKNQ